MAPLTEHLHSLIPQSRLLPPQLADDILNRTVLIEQFNQAVMAHSLTLVSAPAGSGKTTLVASWFHNQPPFPVTWLRLTEEENDLTRFFLTLFAGLRQLAPQFGKSWYELIAESSNFQGSIRQLVTVLFNEISASQIGPFAIVFDDLHTISSESVMSTLGLLIEELPAEIHLIVTSRYDPPLSLARLQLQGKVAEFRLDELRFSEGDAQTLLSQLLQFKLAESELALLQMHTGGWVAGLRLLALSLIRLPADSHKAFLDNLTQSGRYLFDFLVQEIYNHQPGQIKKFLLATSILDELTPPLCVAATEQPNVLELLDNVFRRNLFLTNIIGEDGTFVYRYHDLFAEFLQIQLKKQYSTQEIQAIHRRVARSAKQPETAIHHLLAAGLWQEAALEITQLGRRQLEEGFVHASLKRSIEQLPEKIMAGHPMLGLFLGVVAVRSGHMDTAKPQLEAAARALLSNGDEADHAWAQIYLAAALLETDGPASLAEVAGAIRLDLLPGHMQVLNHLMLLWTYFPAYNWPKVEEHFSQAVAITLTSGDERAYRTLAQHLGAPLFFTRLGLVPMRQFCQQAIARFGNGNNIIQMGVYLQQAIIAGLEGRLDDVMVYSEKVFTISQRLGGFAYVDQSIGFAQAIVSLAHDNHQAGEIMLDSALRQADERGQMRGLLAGLAYFIGRAAWLAGNAERIEDMRQLLDSLDNRMQPLEAEATHELLNAYAADLAGRYTTAEISAQRAIQLQNRFKHPINTGCTRLTLAELYLKWHRPSEALSIAKHSLAEWEKLDMPGVPLLHGSNIIPLLKLAIKHDVQATFAKQVLDSFPTNQDSPQRMAVPETGETLTPRETEVLHLLMEGASNRTIAQKLTISERTVKSHVTKILAKLNVSSRAEAVAKARSLLS